MATTYYIDPTGNDTTGNGTIGTPWKSLYKACSTVTTAGDTIHVNAGNYTETKQSTLAVGVNIEGEGNTSIIKSEVSTNNMPTILLNSDLHGTSGNQSISYIRMDGSLFAYSAIMVATRSDISIHHCEIEDFNIKGISLIGQLRYKSEEPSIYATGNRIHNNIFINNADYTGSGKGGDGRGNIEIGGQDGLHIFNNIITQEDRGESSTGYPIKFCNAGYYKNLKIYGNTITKPPYDNVTWDFAFELWSQRGGIEIYNNTIQGSIDFGGYNTNDDAQAGYAVKIYDNSIGQSALRVYNEAALIFELDTSGGVYIYNNRFYNMSMPIQFWQLTGDKVEDIYMYSNVFKDTRLSTNGLTGKLTLYGSSGVVTFNNINYFNNTVYNASANTLAAAFYHTPTSDVYTNVNICNNIVQGAYYPIKFEDCSINTLIIKNNIFYGDQYDEAIFEGCTVTGLVEENYFTGNPSFIDTVNNNFRLLSNSYAIHNGVYVGINYDQDGNKYNTYPSIGAYEYSTINYKIPVNNDIKYTVKLYNNSDVTYDLWPTQELPTEDLYDGLLADYITYAYDGFYSFDVSSYLYDGEDNLLGTGKYSSGIVTDDVGNFKSLDISINGVDYVYVKNEYYITNYLYQFEHKVEYVYNDPPGEWALSGLVTDVSQYMDASIMFNINALYIDPLLTADATLNKNEYYNDSQYKYVDKSQYIAYNSGVNKFELTLEDEPYSTLAPNTFTTTPTSSLAVDASFNPYDSSILFNTWTLNYYSSTFYNLRNGGYNYSGIDKWFYFYSNNNTKYNGLYYKFVGEITPANSTLNIKYKLKIWPNTTSTYTVRCAVRLGANSKNKPNGMLFLTGANNDVSIALSNANEFTKEYAGADLTGLCEVSFDIDLSQIKNELAEKQVFIVGFYPTWTTVGSSVVNSTYIGDIEITMSSDSLNNSYLATIPTNFLKNEETDLRLYDIDDLNYKNGFYYDSSVTSRTYLWTKSEASTNNSLAYHFIIDRLKNLNKTRLGLNSDILIDKVYKPLSVFYDNYLTRDGSIPFVAKGYSYDLLKNIASLESIEFSKNSSFNIPYDASIIERYIEPIEIPRLTRMIKVPVRKYDWRRGYYMGEQEIYI